MAKKITVYTVLIVLLVAMLLANAFTINFVIFDLVTRQDNRADKDAVTCVKVSEKTRSNGLDNWIRIPEGATYYKAYYGMINTGDAVSFGVETSGGEVAVKAYEVTFNKFESRGEGEELAFEENDRNQYFSKLMLCDGFAVAWTEMAPHTHFIFISSSDEETVREVADYIIISYLKELNPVMYG